MMQKTLAERFARQLPPLKALWTKEAFQIVRDPSTILISVVLPLILLFLYGYGVSLDLDHLRIGLVLEDTAPDAQSFAKSMTDDPYFDVKIVRDRRETLPRLMSGAIRGLSWSPPTFPPFGTRRHDRAHPGDRRRQRAQHRELCPVLCARRLQQLAFQEAAQRRCCKGLPLVNVAPRYLVQ